MIWIDNISLGFEVIATTFDEIADSVDGIPLLGGYFAIPFYFIASKIQNLSDNFVNFSDWCDSIGEVITGEVGGFINLLSNLRGEFVDTFNALPSFEELITFLEGRFEILTKTPEQVVEWIKEYLPPIPTTENIIEWVSNGFESILDKLFEEGK